MTIQFKNVTRENFDEITDLQLLEHQREFVASNSYSIAQASFYPHFHTRAIYAAEQLIGFLLYVSREEGGGPNEFEIWRFMIDSRHQGKGHGRAAMELLLQLPREERGARQISICYRPENTAAKDLYASLGFVETEIDGDGEMIAELTIPVSAG